MRSEREPYTRFEVDSDRILNFIEFLKISPTHIETSGIYVSPLPKSSYTVATLLHTETSTVLNIHEEDLQKIEEKIDSDYKLAKGRRGIVRMNISRFSQEFKAERKAVRARLKK